LIGEAEREKHPHQTEEPRDLINHETGDNENENGKEKKITGLSFPLP
jgi:hypothetical protein